MHETYYFSLFDNEKLIKAIAKQKDYEIGQLKLHSFQDKEMMMMMQISSKLKN